MEFTLKLDLPDAEQEAVWLNDRIQEEAIDGLDTGIVKTPQERGAMSGEIWTEVLMLAATVAVEEVMKYVITLVFDHFKGKKAKLELTGKCPNNGHEFKLAFETAGEKHRTEAIAEFNRLMVEFCGQTPNTNPEQA